MFIIKKISDNSLHLWMNSRNEDFAQFLPANLQTSLDDIEMHLLPDNVDNKLNVLQRVPKIVDNAGSIALELYESVSDDGDGNPVHNNLIETVPTQKIDYPYDENGDFVEPAEFIPN